MSRLDPLFKRFTVEQSAEGPEQNDTNVGEQQVAESPLEATREADALYAYLFDQLRQADYADNPESDRVVLRDGTELLGRIQEESTPEELVMWTGVCLTADKSECQRRIPMSEVAEIERGRGVPEEERDRVRAKAERLVERGVPGLPDLLRQAQWRMLAFDEPLPAVVERLWKHGVACAYDDALTDVQVTVEHWEGNGIALFSAIAESAGCRFVISRATVDFVRT